MDIPNVHDEDKTNKSSGQDTSSEQIVHIDAHDITNIQGKTKKYKHNKISMLPQQEIFVDEREHIVDKESTDNQKIQRKRNTIICSC